MCGIAGIIGSSSLEVETCAARMMSSVEHRGPDDHGLSLWRDAEGRRTAFAHRRLSIIDLSAAGRQPMTTRDGRYSVVFNGEIYNYGALRAELQSEGVEFTTDTDTEALLHLYARRGAECLRSLRGMFAFAVRDAETGEVFAARDRLGIKPFYYYSGERPFLFASEVRALLASGLVPRLLDIVALNAFLSFGAVQDPLTLVRGVRALPPGHFVRVSAAGEVKEVSRYWDLPSTKHGVSREEAVAETRRLLEESTRLHLVSDVPLGAFLSGGIDSSTIVALMTRVASTPVETFIVCFDEGEFSEREFARLVAERLGSKHTEIELTEGEILASLPQSLDSIDQPTIDGINTWAVSRATKAAGITVALSGLGGDELFGGYPSFGRVALARRYSWPVRRLHPAGRRQLASAVLKVMGDSLQAQKISATIACGGDVFDAYASVRGLFAKSDRAALAKRLAGGGGSERDYELPGETLSLVAGRQNGDLFNSVSRYEIGLYMANMLLRDTDAMSMAHSLEVRVPFLDHDLVEWVYALPGEIKGGRGLKPLLVDAVKDLLPPEILGRKKIGFALPFDRWLRTSLRAFAEDTLRDETAVRSAGLEPSAVSDVLTRFGSRSNSTSWSRVWGLVVLVDWCRRHGIEAPQ